MAGEDAFLNNQGWLYHPDYPDHWERCPLYSMAQWINGLAFRDIDFTSTGMPVIKIAEIKGGISGQTKFTQKTFDASVRVSPGDLLFSWSGQPETSIDVFWWHGPDGWLNQHIFRIMPADGIDSTFFYYFLRYLKPNFVGIARNKQTTGLGHVTKRDLQNIDGAYPHLSEQRAIAHILGTLDDKIENLRRQNETLEAMARALFKAWFVDFEPVRAKIEGRWRRGETLPGLPAHLYDLFPDRLVESELGEIPEGWESAPASKLIEFNPPESLRKGTEAPYIEMAALPTIGSWPEPPVLRPFGSGMRFRNGDTLLARITPCLENGKTAFIQCLPENTVGWGSTEFIVMRPKPPLPPEFGYLLARDVAFREQAIRSMTGTSGRQRVQAGSLAAFKIAVPSNNDAWSAFSSIVTPAFKSIKANAETAATLAHFRDTLLLKLISGELRIKDAERFLQERGL
ncbi:MAG: restriction endonuclease subunit S [Fulvimonas sp.]|nr:restriction endonuclease subunit S [Fulvimonas sp.]